MTASLRLEDGKIFVGGLHAETTEESLRGYFQQFGEIEDSNVMFDPITKRSRGFGFVTFKDPECVKVACDHSRAHYLDNKKIDPKPAYEKGAEARVQERIHLTKVFIGGVPQGISDEVIKEHFSKYGTVINVSLKRDKATDRMRGFGFVDFTTQDEAAKAAVERYQMINGKTVEVKPAEARRRKDVPYTPQGQFDPAAAGAYAGYGRNPEYPFNQQGYPPQPPNFQQPYPPYGYGGNNSAGYGQGGYGNYQGAQDYSAYGRPPTYGQSGPSYGQGAPSYGQQDYSYPRNYGNQQQQMPNYPPPPPPQEVGPQAGAATAFNQQRSSYSSNTETYPGQHPTFGGYGGSAAGGYDGYSYPGEQTTQTNTGYGRGATHTGGSFGYNR